MSRHKGPDTEEGETRPCALARGSPALRRAWEGTLHHEPHLITFPADDELKLGRYQRVQAVLVALRPAF